MSAAKSAVSDAAPRNGERSSLLSFGKMALRAAAANATVSRTRPHHSVKMSAATISVKPTVTQVSVARVWLPAEPGDVPVRRNVALVSTAERAR